MKTIEERLDRLEALLAYLVALQTGEAINSPKSAQDHADEQQQFRALAADLKADRKPK